MSLEIKGRISYDPLWKLLEERGIARQRLREHGIHPKTIAKMGRDETITTDTIIRICYLLDCQPSDIMVYIKEDSNETRHEMADSKDSL